jgi:murein DD-endopeptidase MepM/ murein hydrolase activator NlpD
MKQIKLKKSASRRIKTSYKQAKSLAKKSVKLASLSFRLAGTTFSLVTACLRWFGFAGVLAILTLPYQIWRAFMPNRVGSQPISRFFRRAFEGKHTKRVLGANLAALVLASSVLQVSFPNLAAASEPKEVLPEPKEVLTTETTFRQPVGGYLSQDFSWYHPGIDVAGNDNQIIYPISGGTVLVVETGYFGYGNSVIIQHDRHLTSRYAHLSKVKVEQGETVDKNTALGYVGSTGWSTGPHLHLEIYQDGEAINPLSVLPAYFEQ